MEKQELKEKVREIIAELLEVEESEILDDSNFVKDLGADSLKALELLAALEKEYRIRIPEDKLGKLRTLNDTMVVLQEVLNK